MADNDFSDTHPGQELAAIASIAERYLDWEANDRMRALRFLEALGDGRHHLRAAAIELTRATKEIDS